jgi:molybdopterin synthase catalytic subunit
MVMVTKEFLTPEGISKNIPFPESAGSVVVHFAVVKPAMDGRPTAGIRFGAAGDIEAELRTLEAKLRDAWKISDVMLARRIGSLKVGDIISVAVVAAGGREAAFGACGDAVELFKSMKSLHKEELVE